MALYHVFLSSEHELAQSPWSQKTQPITLAGEPTLYFSITENSERLLRELRESFSEYSWAVIADDKPIKAAFFDMDGTLISGESLVELAQRCLSHDLKEEIEAITTRAMQGGISFVPALKERMARFQGTKQGELEDIAASLELHSGSKELVKSLKENNIPCYLVTGGIKVMAVPVARKLGMEGVCANVAKWVKEPTPQDSEKEYRWILSGEMEPPFIDGEAKAEYVQEICQERGLTPEDVMIVGDGANDYAMAELSGFAVGFHPKKILLPALNAVNYTDSHLWLKELIDHLHQKQKQP